jgi:hypothetical protein
LKEIHRFARGNKIDMVRGMSQPGKEDFVLAMMKFRLSTTVIAIILLRHDPYFRVGNIAGSPISQYVHGPVLKQAETRMDRRSFTVHL